MKRTDARILAALPFLPAAALVAMRRFAIALFAMLAMAAGPVEKPAGTARPFIGISPEGITCVIGATSRNGLIDGPAVAPAIKPMHEFSLVTPKGPGSTIWSTGKAFEVGGDGECERHFQLKLSLKPAQLGRHMLAISGTKRRVAGLLPKDLETLSPKNPDVIAIASRYLKSRGLAAQPVNIVQAFRVDLNGDGAKDMIINVIHTQRATATSGEYAIVLAHLVTAKDERTVTLAEDITPETTSDQSTLWENTIVAIADLDGDGVMEIVVYGEFFHGEGWEVLRVRDGKADHPLFCGCGG